MSTPTPEGGTPTPQVEHASASVGRPPVSVRDGWHAVEVDCEWGGFRFICTAPVDADCRCLPACQHIGGPCADCEGEHGGDCPGDMTPVDTGECVIEPWIDNGEECGRGTVTIPVTTEWTGEWWMWSPVGDVR